MLAVFILNCPLPTLSAGPVHGPGHVREPTERLRRPQQGSCCGTGGDAGTHRLSAGRLGRSGGWAVGSVGRLGRWLLNRLGEGEHMRFTFSHKCVFMRDVINDVIIVPLVVSLQVGYSGIQAGVGPGAVALTGPMAAVGALQSAAVAQVSSFG